MQTKTWVRIIGWAFIIALAASLSLAAEDEGFDVSYEGVVDSQAEAAGTDLNLALYGKAGTSGTGVFWASAGIRAGFSVEGFAVHADAGYGTNGLEVQAGAETEILGFGVAGDTTWTPGSQPTIDLRGWGTLDLLSITANVRLSGGAPAITLSASTDLEGFGLSANFGFAGGNLSQASVGANTKLGGLSVSANAGLNAGAFNVGGGAGLKLGPLNLIANAGYDGTVGINAAAGGTIGWEAFEVNAIGLYDNTGVGLELSSELSLGAMTVSFMGRFSAGGLNAEVGASLPLGALAATVSVAFDSQNGFSWAEVGIEMPL